MDIEHKLDLIQQIHREQGENELYIYDKSWMASFLFRLLIAVLLFLCFFVMDKKEIVYKEIGSSKIVQYISENMDIEELQYLLIKNDNQLEE